VIRGAAAGRAADRDEFARRYLPVVRAYLCARWRGTRLIAEVEDAVQEVFLDCFRDEGALTRADPDRASGFRTFLFGVTRNVALRLERKRARERVRIPPGGLDVDRIEAGDPELSTVFDRAWAVSIIEQAGKRQLELAREQGPDAERRYEILRLRFEGGLAIRDIARRLDLEPARAHKEYARAREEFRAALLQVVAFHSPGLPGEVERESVRLLGLLS